MLKEYTKPELTIETWKTENILTQSSSLADSIGSDSSYRKLGEVVYDF